MNRLVFAAIVAASILAPPIASHAIDANGNTVVYGNGVDTCAEVLVHSSTGERQIREYWRMIYLQWLTGYMSVYVAATPGAVDVSFGLPNNTFLDALLSTCSGMPREIFAHVARKNLEGLTSIK
jgi:hypothetical protein